MKNLSTSDRISLATAIATVLLAVVTAWLAWTTYKVTVMASNEINLEHRVLIYRECVTASPTEAKNGDSLMSLSLRYSDGYEYNERLSLADIRAYLKPAGVDFLRCRLVNYGKLPVLNVQMSFGVQFGHQKPRAVVMSPVAALSADPNAPDSKYTMWIVNSGRVPITIYIPNLVRYTTVENEQPTMPQRLDPHLNDRWIIAPGRDVQEILDQRYMQNF